MFRLDEALAGGAAPDSTPALTLRAQRLMHPVLRAQLGCDLERALAQSGAGAAAVGAAAELVARLRSPGPVDPAGVARARLLLVDGRGPLHAPRPGRPLVAAIRTAADAIVPVEA
jgi:hypothetical protein